MADGLEEREEQQLDDDVGGDWPGKEGEVGHHGVPVHKRGFRKKLSDRKPIS